MPSFAEKMNQFRNNRASTLVEVMMTVMIFSFVVGALYMILTTGQRSWDVESARIELDQELRKGMLWMLEDLPEGVYVTVSGVPADGALYSSISFRKAAGVTASGSLQSEANDTVFLVDGPSNRLLHRKAGVDTIIANNVSALQLSRQASSPRVLEGTLSGAIPLNAGASLTVDLPFTVRFRN